MNVILTYAVYLAIIPFVLLGIMTILYKIRMKWALKKLMEDLD